MNLILAAILTLVAFKLTFSTPELTGAGQSHSLNLIQNLMSQHSQAVMKSLDAELEQTEKETSLIADIASHIFSFPQSFRLAAQPGEYDYDPATGLYTSVRNDGNSVLLLSAASPLNPDILHDIRLSEYLNPVFKSALSLKPTQLEIGLYTVDSLIRSYPWFDPKQRVAAGALKKDFRNGDLPSFDKARPEKNPLRKPVWSFGPGPDEGEKVTQVSCSVPFDSSGVFRGVIAATLSLNKIAEKSLAGIESPGQVFLVVGKGNQILSTQDSADSTLAAQLEKIIQALPKEGRHFEQSADVYVLSSTSNILPLRLVSLLPDVQAIKLGLIPPAAVTSRTRPWIMSGVLASLALLLFNCISLVRNQVRLRDFRDELSKSFSALKDLQLDSAFIARSDDLSDALNSAVRAVKKHFEVLTAQGKQGTLEISNVTDNSAPLETMSTSFNVLNCFDANRPIQASLSRLLTLLAEVSQTQRIWFMFCSPEQHLLRASEVGHGIPGEALENLAIRLAEGDFFTKVLTSPQVVCTNSWSDLPPDAEPLKRIVSKNLLICPLLDEHVVFGLLFLADKPDDFGEQDRNRLTVLQEPISGVVKGLLQCEGFRKIDRLRREYCAELKNAVETPLNRIRSEVQVVYSRLGRLTPYYKQHCEAILFEIGRLYEIANEASSTDRDDQASDHR